jgi:hypothetical protein
MTSNGNTKWIVGIIVSILLAAGGWIYGAVQSTKLSTYEMIRQKVETNSQTIVINTRRVDVLEVQYEFLKVQNDKILLKLDSLLEKDR